MNDGVISLTQGVRQATAILARWCDRHRRWECTHQRSRGRGQCHAIAITGTAACPVHAGKTVEAARRDAVTAWAASAGDDGISPAMAVAAQLGLAWRRAQLLGDELRRQAAGDAQGDGDGGQAASITGALIGSTWAASAAAGGRYETGEAVRALAQLEAAERERVVRFAKVAHDMGIDEQMARLGAEQGQLMVGLVRRALRKLGIDLDDGHVGVVVAAEFRALDGGRDD
jgi:hypothetical protein